MYRVFDLLSLIFSRILPFVIVLNNHLYVEGWNIHLIGWILIVLLLHFVFFKPMNEKVQVWDIQNKHTFTVLNYRHMRNVIIFGLIWWFWIALNKNYELIYSTLGLITLSLVTGWLLALIGHLIKNRNNMSLE